MASNVGDRLGHYQVTALVGQGGMGEVYKARDTRLDRTVAVEVLPAHVANDPADLKARFEREVTTRWTENDMFYKVRARLKKDTAIELQRRLLDGTIRRQQPDDE